MLEVTVKDGDTIWGLSRRYGVREEDIRNANSDIIPNGNDILHVGQKLVVPDIYAARVQVKQGDTLWNIAKNYGTTAAQLIKVNKLDSTKAHLIHAGDELVVPRQPKYQSLKTLSGKLDVLGDTNGNPRVKYFDGFILSADIDTLRQQFRHLLEAMRWVETSHIMPAPVGDNGMSIGPLQISSYHMDAWEFDKQASRNYHDVEELTHAEETTIRYWMRYYPWAVQFGDLETLARTHNGGPSFWYTSKTRIYWFKTMLAMERFRPRPKAESVSRYPSNEAGDYIPIPSLQKRFELPDLDLRLPIPFL